MFLLYYASRLSCCNMGHLYVMPLSLQCWIINSQLQVFKFMVFLFGRRWQPVRRTTILAQTEISKQLFWWIARKFYTRNYASLGTGCENCRDPFVSVLGFMAKYLKTVTFLPVRLSCYSHLILFRTFQQPNTARLIHLRSILDLSLWLCICASSITLTV